MKIFQRLNDFFHHERFAQMYEESRRLEHITASKDGPRFWKLYQSHFKWGRKSSPDQISSIKSRTHEADIWKSRRNYGFVPYDIMKLKMKRTFSSYSKLLKKKEKPSLKKWTRSIGISSGIRNQFIKKYTQLWETSINCVHLCPLIFHLCPVKRRW